MLSAGPSTCAWRTRSPVCRSTMSAVSRTSRPEETAVPITACRASVARATSSAVSRSGSIASPTCSRQRASTVRLSIARSAGPSRLTERRSTRPSRHNSIPGPRTVKGRTATAGAGSAVALPTIPPARSRDSTYALAKLSSEMMTAPARMTAVRVRALRRRETPRTTSGSPAIEGASAARAAGSGSARRRSTRARISAGGSMSSSSRSSRSWAWACWIAFAGSPAAASASISRRATGEL